MGLLSLPVVKALETIETKISKDVHLGIVFNYIKFFN